MPLIKVYKWAYKMESAREAHSINSAIRANN